MNELKLTITDKLELVSLVPTIINKTLLKTSISLKNWSKFENCSFKLFLIKDGTIIDDYRLVGGKCDVPTERLNKATNLSVVIKDNALNTTKQLDLDLSTLSYEAQVFVNDATDKYSNLLLNLIEEVEKLEYRIKVLEKAQEQELL